MATVLDQQTYLNSLANPAQLKAFINDWINYGQRGIQGGDGQPASYWDVYQDLAARGIDVSDLPAPDSLQGGTVKGGGMNAPMAAPAQSQQGGAVQAPTVLDQATYLNAKQNPDQLKRFVKDWVNLGMRGITGGDGQPASYWDVYNDMRASGIDVSDLPAPESLAQGTVKGGGMQNSLAVAAPSAGAAAAAVGQPNPEMTDLLSKLGVDYPNAPAATPALLAFLRNLGLNVDSATQAKQASIDRVNRAAADAGSRLSRIGEQEKRNVTADLVRRGVLQSGEANTRYANQAQSLGERQADIARTQAEGINSASDVYQNALNVARTQATGQVMDVEQQQATTKAQSQAQADAYRQQQQAADLAYQRSQQAQQDYFAKQEELLKKYGQVPA